MRKWEDERGSDRFREFLLDQNHTWKLSADNYLGQEKVEEREFLFDGFKIRVQFNPERIRSSAAKVDKESIAARKCFLCQENRPDVQKSLELVDDFILLVNPFPIFRTHFTIPSNRHIDQLLSTNLEAMFDIARIMEGYTLFYNGPESGASAPDHLHFQAGENGFLPVESEYESLKNTSGFLILKTDQLSIWAFDQYLRKMISLETDSKEEGLAAILKIYTRFREIQSGRVEPMINLLCYFNDGKWILHLFPRNLHRPRQFFAKDESQLLISPASVDFGGVFITPRREDFEKISRNDIADIFSQVSLDDPTFKELKLSVTQN
jgi:ATP adenylyltransferase/5',5'''-P-1,P-4-tetraphosphate phosphorylase II